jgi:class 3 adenylate cyclase
MAKRRREAPRRDTLRDFIRKAVATRISEHVRKDPDTYQRLLDLGLVDEESLAELDETQDFRSVIRQFSTGIAEIARREPSVLAELDVRPLEVMCCEEEDIVAAQRLVRTPLTVLFSDLEGFTTFTSARGDEEAGALLTEHYGEVDAIVRSRGGRVIKTIGDGHMLSFEQPAAAVMAAVDLVRASPAPLRLRAGGHLGPVVRTEGDLIGHVVNVAARVTGLAAGGVSLVTVDLRDAAGTLPSIAYEPAHAERVAGLDEPIDVCEVHAV